MDRIIVCVKPVPDPKAWERLRLDPVTKTLMREGIPSVINPLDKHALEAALEIKDAQAAEVVILSMAPPAAQPVLREALAMGADRSVLLSDRAFAGSDTLATSRVLAAGIRRLGHFDLIFCGNFSLDGSTSQVPSQVAELLGIPNIMHVRQMELRGEKLLTVTQKIEQGYVRWEAGPPLLLSDIVFAGSDTLATSRILAAGVRRVQPFDLIFCGNFTLDGSTAQVPSQLAELLGIPNIMHVSRMELGEGKRLMVTQKIEQGYVRLEAEPPLLLSFTKEANKPRFSSFLEILAAEKRELAIWTNAELNLEEGSIGLKGSPTQMADLLVRQKGRQGLRLEGTPEEMAQQLADKIHQLGLI